MQELLEQAGLAAEVEVDSAGTAAYHAGEKADRRSRATARERGVELKSIARQVQRNDFTSFDYLIAMDTDNHEDLLSMARSAEDRAKVYLFRSFDSKSPEGAAVPDPYYGGPDGFNEVFDICRAAAQGLLEHLRKTHGLS